MNVNISLRALRYVVAAGECGNLTEAAKRLNVSQPSISAALAQVEEELGVQLFIRHHARGVTPTPAGARVLNEARSLLNHARDFAQTAQALGDDIRGEIVVGCFWTMATYFMPRLLTGFSELQPGIVISLDEGDQSQILDSLLSGRTEIALSYKLAIPDEIRGELLAELPPCVVLPKDHALAGRRSIDLGELASEPFVLLDLPHSRDYFMSLFDAAGVQPRIAFRTKVHELTRGLVGHGRGYTITNIVPRNDLTHDGMPLVVIPIEGDLEPLQVMSFRLKRQSPRPAVEVFASYLHAAFSPGGAFVPV